MSELVAQPPLQQAGRPLSLIPVGLKEAALDSPTFRATAVHFSDQVEVIERWLDAYIKSISKLVHDVSALEETFNAFLAKAVPPANISEAVLDHDYTLLAMKNFGEGSREWWTQAMFGMKKMDSNVVEPIKAFMAGELRNFKDARRYLEQSQKIFDNTLARYVSQSKTKEPSSLREDAFQVHETRKAYLKASLDFCLLAPQLRYTMDKLLVKVCSEQWREMKRSREVGSGSFVKWGQEMDRVRGWSREMEAGESVFRRELQVARREIADTAANASKPSREIEDYNLSTVAFLGSKGPSTVNVASQGKQGERSEKQGWLFLRTISGKPARTFWVRRWFYVKNGIFGWLVQGAQSGGVEESEKIGVLLCNVKPAVQEERRFCFEVKTKNQTILVQAETQSQLMEWLGAFEAAKNKALETSADDTRSHTGGQDPAFAITPPSVPEFAAKSVDGHISHGSDDLALDRVGSLPVPGGDVGNLATRSSFDVSTAPRRSVTSREEGESSRDHAARIMQKLDLHRRTTNLLQTEEPPKSASPAGGIASLISASHTILPVYSTTALNQVAPAITKPKALDKETTETHTTTLAPSTLANTPAPTNLSKSAVIVSGERGIGIGRSDATGGMPSGIMANVWGSSNWGYINRLERGEIRTPSSSRSVPGSPVISPLQPSPKIGSDENCKRDTGLSGLVQSSISTSTDPSASLASLSTTITHRKTMSTADLDLIRQQGQTKPEVFPGNYPLELKTQEAQFRILFPNVPREDKLLLVFRATWNPNEQQEFPGRVYVTNNDMYFYSHHLGLVLISGVSLDSITEVTAAPGKDCDFIFLHLKEGAYKAGYTRITIKTFLEPLRLLQSRLNFLIDICQGEEPMNLEETMDALIKMENEDPTRSPSMESWEDVSMNTPVDDGTATGRSRKDLKALIHVERGMQLGRSHKEVTKFQLPSQPVIYEPPGMQRKAVERQFEISPKALFHVMFGDKSAVFQLLYHERRAQRIAQGPWVHLEENHMRRDFHFQIDYFDVFRRARQANVVDYQVIEILNDHVCYVVTDMKTPWHLPHHKDFMLVSKIVITHVAKGKCKLAIYTKVEWSKEPKFSKGLVEKQAFDDSALDALDLADVVADQVRKLGPQSRTKKAIHIFGHVGQQTSVSLFSAADSGSTKRPQIKQRTLTHMIFEIVSSFGESAITSVMMGTFAVFKTLWKIINANGIILAALLISVMINTFFTSRGASDWWNERNAASFMTRIGVGPNLMMSKAVYLKDLDDILTGVSADVVDDPHSKCFSHFQSIANYTDLDAPYQTAGNSFSETSTRSTARRLRRTRQHLGSYRHDLIVAMRVVNNVEREMIQAEWENWLLDENMRCRQVQMMLEDNQASVASGKAAGQEVIDAKHKSRLEGLRSWQEEYCGSCMLEQKRLSEMRRI